MNPLPQPVKLLLVILVVTAAVHDLRARRIPNWLVLSGLLLGTGLNWLLDDNGLKTAGLGIGLALLIYFPLYMLRAMGAGDVKLMAAVGAVVGPGTWVVLFLITAVLGGVVAVILLLYRRSLKSTMWNVGWIANELRSFRAPYQSSEQFDVRSAKAVRLPHGAVIALGAIAFLTATAYWLPAR